MRIIIYLNIYSPFYNAYLIYKRRPFGNVEQERETYQLGFLSIEQKYCFAVPYVYNNLKDSEKCREWFCKGLFVYCFFSFFMNETVSELKKWFIHFKTAFQLITNVNYSVFQIGNYKKFLIFFQA